jgi:hypothetical protein
VGSISYGPILNSSESLKFFTFQSKNTNYISHRTNIIEHSQNGNKALKDNTALSFVTCYQVLLLYDMSKYDNQKEGNFTVFVIIIAKLSLFLT